MNYHLLTKDNELTFEATEDNVRALAIHLGNMIVRLGEAAGQVGALEDLLRGTGLSWKPADYNSHEMSKYNDTH